MSQINVTTIKSRVGGAPTFSEGLVSSGISTFSSNVTIGGTLTYDDVTNIDSVGMITAQGGINVSAGNVKVNAGIVTVGTGVTISSDFIHLADNKKIQLGIGSDVSIYHDGSNTHIDNNTGHLFIRNNVDNDDGSNIYIQGKSQENSIICNDDGAVELYHDNTAKIETISTGASVYGGLRLQGGGLMREHFATSGTALNSDKVINCSSGMVHYRSSAVGGANVKLNVISTAGINTDMAIGDAMTLTVAGSSSHFVDQIRIDGVEASAGVTTHWVGGSAPTDGGSSGVDTYAFNILKTGNATYVAVANQVKTS